MHTSQSFYFQKIIEKWKIVVLKIYKYLHFTSENNCKKKIAVAPQLFKIVFDMDQEFLGYQSKFSEALRQVKKKQISAQNFWIGVL